MKVKYPYKEIQNAMYETNTRLTCKCFTIKEVNDNGKTKFETVYKSIKEKNQIAHCNEDYVYEEDDYENLLFDFIRLQYLITYGKDIDAIFKTIHSANH